MNSTQELPKGCTFNGDGCGATLGDMLAMKGINPSKITSLANKVKLAQKKAFEKKPKKKVSKTNKTSSPKVNSFTVDSSGVNKGIEVLFGSQMAIYVGSRQNGGWEKSVLLDQKNPPKFKEAGKVEMLYRGGVTSINTEDGRLFHSITGKPEKDTAITLIKTGRKAVVKSCIKQDVRFFGSGSARIVSGEIKSRTGGISSIEQLWLLEKDSSVIVFFYDGRVRLISYDGENVLIRNDKEATEKCFQVILNMEGVDLKVLSSCDYETIKKRDRVYYKVIDASRASCFEQGALKIFAEAVKKQDLRFNVLESLLKAYANNADALPQLFKILCDQSNVESRLATTAKNDSQEAVDKAVKACDSGLHKAMDIATKLNWWGGVADLLAKANKNGELRCGVFTRFSRECPDKGARLLVGDRLIPGSLKDVSFLKKPETKSMSAKPKRKKYTRAQVRAAGKSRPSKKETKEKKGKKKS